MIPNFRKKEYSPKHLYHQSLNLKPFNAKKIINKYLQTPSQSKSEKDLFNAFSKERDHIGRLISPKSIKPTSLKPLNPIKLTLKVSKNNQLNSSNCVLVRRNNFLFFEKGKKMRASAAPNSIVGDLMRSVSNAGDENSIEFSRNSSIIYPLLDSTMISKNLPKMKFVPNAKDSNHNLELKQKIMKKIGKIIDPVQQEKEFSLISHLGLYDVNYSLTIPKAPSVNFSKALKSTKLILPAIKNEKSYSYLHPKREKLYKKGEFEDERLLFAKVMKEVEVQLNNQGGNDDMNLGIDQKLDYRYSHSKDFVKGFHKDMKAGFEKVKQGFLTIKMLNDKWEKEIC